jgi:hypothetical protein
MDERASVCSQLSMVPAAVNYRRFFAHRQLTAVGAFQTFCGVFQPYVMCQQQISFYLRCVYENGDTTEYYNAHSELYY